MTNLRQQVVSLLDPRRQDRLFQRFDAVLRIVSEKVYQARQITDLWLTHEVNWHMVSTVYSGVKRLQQNYVKNGQNQAIRIPREFVFRGFNEVTLYTRKAPASLLSRYGKIGCRIPKYQRPIQNL